MTPLSFESRPLKKADLLAMNHLSSNMSNNVSPRPDVPIRTHRKGREEEKRYIDDTLDIRRIAGRYNTDR